MYIINELNKIKNKEQFLQIDENGREIFIYNLTNCMLTGESLFYPNPLIYTFENDRVYNPIKEKILSLEKLDKIATVDLIPKPTQSTEHRAVFYFIYNTDNYYHFIYDTLPYLITYKHLKTRMDIKLLMNFPNSQKLNFYKFVIEFLNILGITNDDIIMVNNETLYKNVYISTSYTHDINSNLPPRKEVYPFYREMVNKIKSNNSHNFSKKIYISRRSWIHNDVSNIGTNYTSRRVMTNETELVNYLTSINYAEIFTENLSTVEKIIMFSNATDVIGAFGGGISNVLFSEPTCNLLAICSPGFLDVNKRFIHSLSGVYLNIFNNTFHSDNGEFLKYMRVKYNNIIGEIINIEGDNLTIAYLDEFVSGWNNNMKYKEITVNSKSCIKLDNGLNSPWTVDIKQIKRILA